MRLPPAFVLNSFSGGRYARLIKQTQRGDSAERADFLQSGDTRAAIVKVAVAHDLQYVAAVDTWGYLSVWDHKRMIEAMAGGKGWRERDPLVARWKVSEGPVLDMQFTKHKGKTCVLLLLPPAPSSPPSSLHINVPSLFALDSLGGGRGEWEGELVATWQPSPPPISDRLSFVITANPLSSPSHPQPMLGGGQGVGKWEGEGFEDDDHSAASSLALHINNKL